VPASTKRPGIIVDGDVTMDWNLAELSRPNGRMLRWSSELRSRMCWQRGGAALLEDLLSSVLETDRRSVRARETPREPVCHGDPAYHHAYAIWHRDEDDAWRVHHFLGVDPARTAECGKAFAAASTSPALIVLDDAALGFRDTESAWPQAIHHPDDSAWVLLKTASPVAAGRLWKHLVRTCPHRLVVVLTVEDLRHTEVQISRGLSWERTAQDIIWEILHNPRVNGLGRCAHVVVSFGTAGAILHSSQESSARLIFDPAVMEEEWEPPGQGRMIGTTATLTAALARELVCSKGQLDLVDAIRTGVEASRALHCAGYVCEVSGENDLEIGFPLEVVAAAIRKAPTSLACVEVQNPVRFLNRQQPDDQPPQRPGFWTILEDRYRDDLQGLAESIVIHGLSRSLSDVPIGRIGFLTTVDRHEMESLRSIRALMREYCRHRQPEPLSMAVFGPPGSGKSFGVAQVAKAVLPGSIESLTFNLSQFDDPRSLLAALHQVRDVGLSGRLPLVFWDEFDTPLEGRPLGWLRYFLAPMQDGTFQEGQITHPIGRAIFVFAGGTCATMEEFSRSLATDEQRKEAKLPDFVSRLRGFLNVLGPNPQHKGRAGGDPYFIIRRAILLRSMLEREAGHLLREGRLRIDTGVLRALLQIGLYKHGARSIKSILAMSELAGRQSFQRSSLPPESQLNLHVDGREFLSLVQSIVLTEELTEQLAAAAHEVWCDSKRRDGWNRGPEKSEASKTHPWMVPYEELPDAARRANRVTVRTIPQKLARAGYAMMPARSDETSLEFPGEDLEQLARLEHELWMQGKLEAGFHLGSPTPDDPLQNEYLVPWELVPAEIQEADRDLVRGIPRILARAGYTIVNLNGQTEF
jgi:hypothetical protein